MLPTIIHCDCPNTVLKLSSDTGEKEVAGIFNAIDNKIKVNDIKPTVIYVNFLIQFAKIQLSI